MARNVPGFFHSRRQARVRALAKINLDLRVLGRRADGYHELRTIFQTISLADTLQLAFTPARRTTVQLADEGNIPDNLVVRAARLVLDSLRITGRVEMRLRKRIPMGAGLGGGSSDAAAVLLALPVLAGAAPGVGRLLEMGQQLGSDVPFFLLGGRAAGIGRGSELFPLPDGAAQSGVVVASGIHVSTAEAYQRLSPGLTTESLQNKISCFQSQIWGSVRGTATNDFEEVVFGQHRRLAALKKKLNRAGASLALMTGSGSAVFGLFPTVEAASGALDLGLRGGERVFPITLVSRARYRSMWWRALQEHIEGKAWPPCSRYA